MYDSRPDTLEHIRTVQGYINEVIDDLQRRADQHDQSKLVPPEREMFDEYTPKLRVRRVHPEAAGQHVRQRRVQGHPGAMGPALAHHYAVNDHHPEHFEQEAATHGARGIEGMNLVQILEMLCDWKAATLRHDDGDLARSIEQNAGRFGYGDEIKRLLSNTAHAMGWA